MNQVYELLIELTDFDLHQATAHYSAFAIGTESEGYDLRLLGTYEGDAGDSLTYHVVSNFVTWFRKIKTRNTIADFILSADAFLSDSMQP